MTSNTQVFEHLDFWIAQGWLSQLNRAFAKFLLEQEPTANPAVIWAGALVSHQLDRGEVFLDLEKLCQQPTLTLGIPNDAAWKSELDLAQHALLALKAFSLAAWLSALQHSSLVSLGTGNTPLVLQGQRLYLRRYWQYQQTLAQHIQQRLRPVRSSLSATGQDYLHALFPPQVEQVDWQKIACALALRAGFSIITGGPGTGKTTTVTKLLALLIHLQQNDVQCPQTPTILLAAPTGKAAARVSDSIVRALANLDVPLVIKQAIPQKATTLHRLLGSRPETRSFKHHRYHPLVADIVIIDEASMIDLEMMAALLEALPAKTQLILLGDKDQLASVEAGSVMGDLCLGADHAAYHSATLTWIQQCSGSTLGSSAVEGSAINQQTVMLRHSHRFNVNSGIGQLAQAVNSGSVTKAQAILAASTSYPDLVPEAAETYFKLRKHPSAVAAMDLLKTLSRINTGTDASAKANPRQGYGYYLALLQDRPDAAVDFEPWAQRILAAFDCFQVLCALRQGPWGVIELNQRISEWLLPEANSKLWYAGRPVMITRNDYNLGLMNGDIGIALPDSQGKLRVAFPNDDPLAEHKIRWISPLRLPEVETAFAITVHKSQGSEFNHVVLVLPEYRSPVITRELIYTGITRAKKNFTLVESHAGVFDGAIQVTSKVR